MNEFKLNDLLGLSDQEQYDYKLHIAKYNHDCQPLDIFMDDFNEWINWNEWRGGRNDFNRTYIFTLIADYHHTDRNIFGGIFKIVDRFDDWEETTRGYEVKVCEKCKSLIGRLVVESDAFKTRGRAFKMENYLDCCKVFEILEKPYQGVDFPGYDNVLIDFSTLEILVANQKDDWRVALENMKGIYLIADKNNGKKYVGSASGDYGIWSRWCTYANTAHGDNDMLVELIKKEGMDYARKYFQLSILEIWPMHTPTDTIINRESYWKEVLLTREFGYNKN